MKKYKYDRRVEICGKQYRIRANSLKELTQKIEAKTREIEESSVVISGNTTLSKWAETTSFYSGRKN